MNQEFSLIRRIDKEKLDSIKPTWIEPFSFIYTRRRTFRIPQKKETKKNAYIALASIVPSAVSCPHDVVKSMHFGSV